MSSELLTVAEVVKALGNTGAVAAMTNRKSGSVVSNWRKSGRFPANTYLTIRRALKQRNLSAPDSLWPMGAEA